MTTPRLAWGLLKVGSLASSESPRVALLDVSERNWHFPGIGCTVTWWFILGNHQDLAKDGIQVFGGRRGPGPSGTRRHPKTWEFEWYREAALGRSSSVGSSREGYVMLSYGR
jgi:hypothetical protein